MGYCFMTIDKIKDFKKLASTYAHNYRKKEVLNADPDKKELNRELVSLNGKTYIEAFKDRTKELGYGTEKKIRSNAVYGFEVVTTFSREDAEKIDLEKWKEDNVKWLKQAFNANPEKYGDNVLSVVYHADEPGNVHCHAFVIPIDDKGNLNSRYYVQNRQKMIALQDSYAKAMKTHNLDRGIKNSSARHQDIKRMYTALNMTISKELPPVIEGETAKEYRDRINEPYKDLNLQNMGLKDKLSRATLELDQKIKNAVSAARKELYDKFQDKAEHMEELEREFGSYEEVKEKCESFDSLIAGIAEEENRDDYIMIVNSLIDHGRKAKEKEKAKNTEKEF